MWIVIEQGEYGEIRDVTTFECREVAKRRANALAKYMGTPAGIPEIVNSGDFSANVDGTFRVTLWEVGN